MDTRPISSVSLICRVLNDVHSHFSLRRSLQFAQHAEQLAKGARRLAELLLLQCIAAQLTQLLQVGLRMRGGNFANHRFVFEKARAQALQRMHARVGGGRNVR